MPMATKERINEFGSKRLKLMLATMSIEQFQQEMEIQAISDGASLIPWDFILKASQQRLIGENTPDPMYERVVTVDELRRWAHDNGLKLIGGYDVGRKHNTSELTIMGYNEREDYAIEKFTASFAQKKLPDQTDYLRALMMETPELTLALDASGLGMEMGERLEREFRGRVVPVEFDYYQKLGIFDAFASRVINGRVNLLPDEERRRQLRSIKRKTTESGRIQYYVSRKERHHADMACSQALAVHAIGSVAGIAPFSIYTGGSMARTGGKVLEELSGGRDEFLRDVVNV